MGKLIAVCLILAAGGLLLRPIGGASSPGWPLRLPTLLEQRGATTVLAVGLDRRGTEIARTDAIAIVRIGPAGSPSGLLSIPRDLWVTIPDRGYDRINTAYTWGDLTTGDGVSVVRRTVEHNFGVRIDRVVVVDFRCFEAAIDAVGGVEVQVAERLVDPAYPAADGSVQILVFEPGWQRLSGERALQYVRIRAPDSDFSRIRRQQQIMAAFAGRVQEPVEGIRVAGALARRCPGSGTDLSPLDLVTLGTVAVSGRDLKMRMITESMVSPATMPSGAEVLLPHWERIRPVVADVFSQSDG